MLDFIHTNGYDGVQLVWANRTDRVYFSPLLLEEVSHGCCWSDRNLAPLLYFTASVPLRRDALLPICTPITSAQTPKHGGVEVGTKRDKALVGPDDGTWRAVSHALRDC